MFKTFASALLAASALATDTATDLSLASKTRGKADGTSNEDAVYCDLGANDAASIKMDLYTYMQNTNDQLEWHGETKVYLKDINVGTSGVQEFGVCFQMTEKSGGTVDVPTVTEATWDCQSIELRLTTQDGFTTNTTDKVQFTNEKDWKYTGEAADFDFESAVTNSKMVRDQALNDAGVSGDSISNKAAHNWQISASKTFSNCSAIPANFPFNISCDRPLITATDADWMKSGVTYHWFRNFKTQDEAGYDLEVKGTSDQKVNAFGFYWLYTNEAKYTDKQASATAYIGGANAQLCTVITEAAYKKLKIDADATNETVDGNKENEKTEDWAAQTTAHATALLAAVYALVF